MKNFRVAARRTHTANDGYIYSRDLPVFEVYATSLEEATEKACEILNGVLDEDFFLSVVEI